MEHLGLVAGSTMRALSPTRCQHREQFWQRKWVADAARAGASISLPHPGHSVRPMCVVIIVNPLPAVPTHLSPPAARRIVRPPAVG